MNRTKKPRGFAFVLVVVVMAAAAIIGFAALSSASIQSQTSKNQSAAIDADALVQSGTNLALYYLMYPEKADPALITRSEGLSFYNPGANIPAMSLASGAQLTRIDITPTNGKRLYVDVTATADSGDSSLVRSKRTTVKIHARYLPKYAMASNEAFTMPLTFLTSSIRGPVRCDGGYGGLISILTGILFGTSDQPTPSFPVKACPSYSELNICKYLLSNNGKYYYDDEEYTAKYISSGTIDASKLTGANASTNPGNVFYVTEDTVISGPINFTGTLIVPSGKSLTVRNGAITITAKPGYPALIVGNDVIFRDMGRNLTVNGVCWIGGKLTGTGTLPSGIFTVNGSLMWGGSDPKIDTTKLLGATSRLVVNYPSIGANPIDPAVPDLLYVPELCDEDLTPKGVKVLGRKSNAVAVAN